MPQGSSSARTQKQAGSAAVHTTHVSQPPDAAAFQTCRPVIGQALQQAGTSPAQLQQIMTISEQLWEACCSYDGTLKSRKTIRTHTGAACDNIVDGTFTQHFLTVLLLRRTMLAANMHPILLSFIKSQQRSSEDVLDCFLLLWIIIDGLPPGLEKSLPKECLPPPSQSTEALAPSHLHPKIMALALKALLTIERDDLFGHYLLRLQGAVLSLVNCGPPEGVAAIRASVYTVLSDQECMDMVWKVLQHPDHCGNGVTVLRALVAGADPPPGGPGSLSHLLCMGAAMPLAYALKHCTEGAEQKQQQSPMQLAQQQLYPLVHNPAERLLRLISTIQKAAMHDWPHEAGPDQHSLEELPPWPAKLLEAFLLGVIKAVELDAHTAQSIQAPSYAPMHLLMLPPPSSYPASARVLSHHPASLSLLISCISRSADRLPISESAMEDCSAGFEFLASLLDSADSEAFQQQLSLLVLCTWTSTVIEHMQSKITNQPTAECISQPTTVELVRATARLIKHMAKLAGKKDATRMDSLNDCAEILGKYEAVVAGDEALSGAPASAGRGSSGSSRARASCMCATDADVHFCLGKVGPGVGVGAGSGGRTMGSSSSNQDGQGSNEAGSHGKAGETHASGGSDSAAGSSKRGEKGGKSERVCGQCGRRARLVCSGCRSAWFCNAECQKKAWHAFHASECKAAAARKQQQIGGDM